MWQWLTSWWNIKTTPKRKIPPKKHYVTWGKNAYLKLAHTPMQACTMVFQDFFQRVPFYESIPPTFIVSYRGHEEHDDDIIVPVEWVLESIQGIQMNLENTCEICGKIDVPLTEVKMVLWESDTFQYLKVCDECLKKS